MRWRQPAPGAGDTGWTIEHGRGGNGIPENPDAESAPADPFQHADRSDPDENQAERSMNDVATFASQMVTFPCVLDFRV